MHMTRERIERHNNAERAEVAIVHATQGGHYGVTAQSGQYNATDRGTQLTVRWNEAHPEHLIEALEEFIANVKAEYRERGMLY